jgi:hypothetical protein
MRQFMPPQLMPSPQHPGYPRPGRRRPRRKFRWYLLTIPLVLFAAKWLAQGIEPAFTWEGVLDALRVRDRERLTQLATLGVLITTAIAIYRVVWEPKDQE